MKNVSINTKIFQNSSFSSILYLFYNADLMKIKKKHKCMLATNFINDTMYATKNRSATINNEILTKIYEKVMI